MSLRNIILSLILGCGGSTTGSSNDGSLDCSVDCMLDGGNNQKDGSYDVNNIFDGSSALMLENTTTPKTEVITPKTEAL